MAITPVSSQNTTTLSLQKQEQQILNQIKSLQKENSAANAAQIKILQQQYNALLFQQDQQSLSQVQQQTQASPSPAPKQPAADQDASTAVSKGINIKA
ncbi:MAG: hypothetical protein P4N59_16535 [Negativicutes bacterium]|nr:hypothetical protein [Negativicutes bacterium]